MAIISQQTCLVHSKSRVWVTGWAWDNYEWNPPICLMQVSRWSPFLRLERWTCFVFAKIIIIACKECHQAHLVLALELWVVTHDYRYTQSIYTYKRVLCVCWFVCFLSATRHLSTLRRFPRGAKRAGAVVVSGPAGAGKHAQRREHARTCRTTSTSRACAEETAGEAAARREEDQHQTAAARDGERLDPVDNVGAFTHNCRDIRPLHWLFRLGFLVDGMLPTDFSLFISLILRLDCERIFILSWQYFQTLSPTAC